MDLASEEILGWAQTPSTVDSNIMLGVNEALEKLQADFGIDGWAIKRRLACSSAAGGLRMVALGLVPELTAEAAKRAALGAGAKLIKVFSYKLDRQEVEAIVSIKPDIILIAGGTDGGNQEVLLYNAALISTAAIDVPVIMAGNKSAASEVKDLFRSQKKEIYVTENVMPELGKLNVEPTRDVIREIFIERIILAKGFQKAIEFVGNILMPTPMAVLKGAELLSRGTQNEKGMGELIVLDIGGATTDVHSISDGRPNKPNIIFKGLPEPYAKRTVEGDLGLRVNARSIWEFSKQKGEARPFPLSTDDMENYISHLTKETSRIPNSHVEYMIDKEMARIAVEIALERHAGTQSPFYLPGGETVFMQVGKDLTGIRTVIGTGGVFKYGRDAREILLASMFNREAPFSLRPKSPFYFVDTDYLLFATGLLGTVAPDAAIRILRRHLKEV
jgi:uncharacterized protein (TIGR01319 family)